MFGSTILDVAIGIVLTFLGVSLASSAITEAISSALKWREHTLLAGIKAMVNDPTFTGVARDLYNHALVNPLAAGAAQSIEALTHKPAYIDSKDFALAFYDVVSRGADPATFIARIENGQLKAALQSLWAAADKDVVEFKTQIGHWFDHAMDRLSGWYKQRTQLVSFIVALVIAGALNANVLYEGAQIWSRPAAIANIGALGKMDGTLKPCAFKAQAGQPDQTTRTDTCVDVQGALEQLKAANLIGWNAGPRPIDGWTWLMAALSWLVVAGSTLFGASFWFDTLQRLIQLRGTGLVGKTMSGGTAKPDIASQPQRQVTIRQEGS